MATYYKTEAAANKAISGNKTQLTKNQAIAKDLAVSSHSKSTVSSLSAARAGAVGSGDLQVICRWKCSTSASQIDHFDLDIEFYSNKRKTWAQLNNDLSKVSVTSVANGFYTYTFSAPGETDTGQLRFHVRPASKSRSKKITYYVATKITSGKKKYKGKYKIEKKTEDVSKPYFIEGSWSAWAVISPAPALQDSNDAANKLKVEKPTRPSKPSAELLSNNAIEVTFDAINTSTAANARRVYRCVDGNYTAAGADISGLITANGTARFVDSRTSAGHEYRYYIRSINTRGNVWDQNPSLPADLCSVVKTPPVEVTELASECYGDGGVKVTFTYPSNAYFPALSSVKVYYASDRGELITNTTSNQSVDVTRGSRNMSVIVTGLDAGRTWYFAVWLKTGDSEQCELFCSSITSCVIATVPEAPTLGTFPRAVYVGDSVDVEWTHNNADGSAQTEAEIYVTASEDGVTTYTHTYTVTTDEKYTLEFDPSVFSDQATATIKVRTKGAGPSFGDWSEDAEILVYAKPNALLEIADADVGAEGIQVTSLPLSMDLSVSASSGTLSQEVVQWRVTIAAADAFVYQDRYGNDAVMAEGETVAEITIDSFEDDFTQPECTMTVSATQAVFSNAVSYTATVYALMDSGLEAEPFSQTFTCEFDGAMGSPSASILPMPDWSARIYPMLVEPREIASGEDYVLDVDVLFIAALETAGDYEVVIEYTDAEGDAQTTVEAWDGGDATIDLGTMGEWASVESVGYRAAGTDSTPTALTGQAYQFEKPVENVLLSVYRIDQDGSMHTVCEDYPNDVGVFAVDRHPSFGEMTYRVVANDQLTDEISSCDVEADNDWNSILVQWDEDVNAYAGSDDEYPEAETFAFEHVELPWNITVQQSSAKDVAYKNYIGRAHPIALFGTHVGEKGSWSCEIIKAKEDYELHQLRRLAAWMGDCWVREPSGLSYPASVNVNITRQYDSTAVAVQLEVTRVDGD